ncbi:hypothetical protein PENDEC_c001G01710 [Penicillium decumbens]|uniref:Uncharacterized protein n=1 Tax=Penicillium decumbens TaxID=69771 RepID=A0A1V6PPK3_PENDC|nr:hypothetical protein PENDEC_c001G01710 [Penicillium decumbens]
MEDSQNEPPKRVSLVDYSESDSVSSTATVVEKSATTTLASAQNAQNMDRTTSSREASVVRFPDTLARENQPNTPPPLSSAEHRTSTDTNPMQSAQAQASEQHRTSTDTNPMQSAEASEQHRTTSTDTNPMQSAQAPEQHRTSTDTNPVQSQAAVIMLPSKPVILSRSGTMAEDEFLWYLKTWREQSYTYDGEFKDLTEQDPGRWQDGDGDGPQMQSANKTNRKPFLKSVTKLKEHHWDVTEWRNLTTISEEGWPKVSPKRVRASDQVVFWAMLHMKQEDRYATWPAEFDSHGDIRWTRVPRGPPMIVEAHGLFWFPVWKGAYILNAEWWTATGWQFDHALNRTTLGCQVLKEFNFGLVLAPPEAVEAAGWVLKLEDDQITPAAGIGIPSSFINAAEMYSIGLTFRTIPNAKCVVILDRENAALDYQQELLGYQSSVGSTTDPTYESYGGSQVHLSPIDWNKIHTGKPRQRVNLKKRKRGIVHAKDSISQPAAPVTITPELSQLQSEMMDVLSMAQGTSGSDILIAMGKFAKLHASVTQSPTAMAVSRREWREEELRYMKELLRPSPAFEEIHRIVSEATDADRKHLLDYFEYCKAKKLSRDEMEDTHLPPPVQSAVKTIFSSIDTLHPERQAAAAAATGDASTAAPGDASTAAPGDASGDSMFVD